MARFRRGPALPPDRVCQQLQIVKLTQRITATLYSHWRSYAAALAAGLFLALSNAFGMLDAPLHLRALFWTPLLLLGTLLGMVMGIRVTRRPAIGENRLILWAMLSLPLACLMSVVAWRYYQFVMDAAPSASFLQFFGYSSLVSGAATAIVIGLYRPGPATHGAAAHVQTAPAQVRFLDRVPARLTGGAIYAVQAEDHYLRIRTSKGSDLILMRLSDAIAELEGIEGAQTHRSWWVAKDGIEKVDRLDGRVALLLKDGAVVPVSRPNVRALRDSGWI